MAINRGPGGSGDATTDSNSQATAAINAAAAAEVSKIAAAASATSASTSASSASTSASSASSSASSASSSASAASSSASSAAASYDSFDDRYLGNKSSAPSVDNDGNTLLIGALYWNSIDNKMYSWSGSSWIVITGSGGGSGTVTSVDMTVPTGLAISGNPITSSGTLAVTYASGYSIPTTTKQGQWDAAYTDRLNWDGGTTGLTASTGRTSLGVTATGSDTTYAYRANNLSDLASASTARTNLGLAIGTNVLAYDSNLQSFVNTFTLPTTDSTNGYVLATNGTGTLSFVAQSGGGASNLDGLSDVVLTSPATGQVLKYNGTNWINDTDSTGSGSFAYPTGTGIVQVTSGSAWGTTLSTTGSGNVVLATSPTLVTPILGTPTSGTLTNCTGYTYANLSGTVPTWNQNTTGSAATLTTARTINGVSFDGSTNITVTANTTNALTVGTGLSLSSGTTFNGSAAVTISNASPMTYPGSGIPNSTGSAWGTSYTTSGSGTVLALATGPTLTSPLITGTITEDVYTITDGAGFAIDPTNGSIQLVTLGASRTPTVANFDAGESVTLMVNDGTAFTITWTTIGVVWVGGSAPTLATTGYTVIELWKVGTTYYGALVGSVA